MELVEFMEIEPFVFLKPIVLNVCGWNNLILVHFREQRIKYRGNKFTEVL